MENENDYWPEYWETKHYYEETDPWTDPVMEEEAEQEYCDQVAFRPEDELTKPSGAATERE